MVKIGYAVGLAVKRETETCMCCFNAQTCTTRGRTDQLGQSWRRRRYVKLHTE